MQGTAATAPLPPEAVALLRAEGIAGRDPVIDGFRALAVLGVIAGHALSYRYAATGPVLAIAGRFAGPISEGGVQLFFVISGYIITSLLRREQERTGTVGIAAFYVRRACRILPPFLAVLAVLAALAFAGRITLSGTSVAAALLFSCNTGVVECDWWVAHSWSLAVEEQFYLVWPLLFLLLGPARRSPALIGATATLMAIVLVQSHRWHGNALSFACIAAGAAYATTPRLRLIVQRTAHPLAWLVVAAALILAPLTPLAKAVDAVRPLLLLHLLFTAAATPPLRRLLTARPLQVIGVGSYSLYLWQQLFLASPSAVDGPLPPILLLPLVAWLSVLLVERPFIRLGHRLSARLRRPAPGRLPLGSSSEGGRGRSPLAAEFGGIAAPPVGVTGE